ncbi:MAG: hypothetical protein ABI360_09645 [Allobranchiibius sp.]
MAKFGRVALGSSILILFAGAACSAGGGSAGSAAVATDVPAASSSPMSETASCKALQKCVAGQKIAANAVQKAVRAAIVAAGGTYEVHTVAPSIIVSGEVRIKGTTTDGSLTQDLNGQKLKIIVIDGVGYLSGTGMGATPFLKVTRDSTGAFAQSVKPLLNIASGAALPGTVHWTVTDTSFIGATLTATPAVGVTMVQTLDHRNLPVRIIEMSGSQTLTRTYSDYGRAVEIQAPPSSEVADISSVASP